MKPESSLPQSYMPATCPYPEPARSSPYPPNPTSWRSILILYFHRCLGLPSGLFPPGFPTKTLYTPLLSPICTKCPVHLIFLDLITRKILSEYRSLCSSLCSFLHSPVTSPLLGPNILKLPQPTFLPQCEPTCLAAQGILLICLSDLLPQAFRLSKCILIGLMSSEFWLLVGRRWTQSFRLNMPPLSSREEILYW